MYIWDIHGCTIPLTNTDPENHYFLEECRLPTHKFGGARVGLVYDLIIKNYSVIRYLLFDYIYIYIYKWELLPEQKSSSKWEKKNLREV